MSSMSKRKAEKQFNSRGYRGMLERELMLGAVLIAVLVGGGIVAWLWGREAFLATFGCIGLAVGVGGVVFLFLKLLEIVSRD
jgi:hypothetical protein